MDNRTKIKKVKDLAKLFERLIAQDHLYSEERIVEMKEALSAIKEQIDRNGTKELQRIWK